MLALAGTEGLYPLLWQLVPGAALAAGRERGCREAGGCGNPVVVSPPDMPWPCPTTTSALSTTGKACREAGAFWHILA